MRRYNDALICSRLQEVLDYSPETGEFRWRVATNRRVKIGALAGCLNSKEYRKIRIDRQVHFAHRLALLYVTGKWPVTDVDHRNGITTDNRICNLREANRSQNNQNSMYSSGSSKYRGVCWSKNDRKWKAQISVDGSNKYLGLFATEELAAEAYRQAQKKYHPFARET